MKDWFKFIGGSFFVNKIALEGARRRFVNVFLSFFLCLVFLYAGLSIGYISSFKTHYNNSTALKSTLYSAFAGENAQERIQLKNDGYKLFSGYNGEYDNSAVINTFVSQSDKNKYSQDGFNLIVDTRPSTTTYVEFEAYYEGRGEKISAEKYREMSSSARSEYTPVTVLSEEGKTVSFNEKKYCDFIVQFTDQTSEKYDPAITYSYETIMERKDSVTQAEYFCSLYELYVKAYYPDVKDDYAGAPSMRTWYRQNVFEKSGTTDYIAILDDTVTGNFSTDGGILVDYSGYYMAMDGFELKGGNAQEAQSSTDSFILKSFSGAKGVDLSIYFINVLQISPLVILVIVALSFILFAVAKVGKFGFGSSFGATFKTLASFMLITSVICFFGAIILSYLVPRGAAYSLTCLIYLSVMVIRTLILAVMEIVKEKKENKNVLIKE